MALSSEMAQSFEQRIGGFESREPSGYILEARVSGLATGQETTGRVVVAVAGHITGAVQKRVLSETRVQNGQERVYVWLGRLGREMESVGCLGHELVESGACSQWDGGVAGQMRVQVTKNGRLAENLARVGRGTHVENS